MLRCKVVASGIRNQAIIDIIDATDGVPDTAIGILLRADGSKRQRTALANIIGRGGRRFSSVGGGAGIDDGQIRSGSWRAGGNHERIAVGKLPTIALHLGNVRLRGILNGIASRTQHEGSASEGSSLCCKGTGSGV